MSGVLEAHLGGRRLSAFIDGELAQCETDRLRSHLLRCPMCTGAVATERAVRARMRQACTPAPSSHLLASLRVVAAEVDPGQPAAQRAGDHPALPHAGARRARRVAAAVMVTTTTVAAVAVVSFGMVPGRVGGPTTTPAAPPTAIDTTPDQLVFVQADLGGATTYGPTLPMMRITWHGSHVYGLTRLGGQ